MKTLLVLRHAKSSWKDTGLSDHDRPLNKRGKKAAPRMGAFAAEQGLVPELIISSTAHRARSTARRFAEAAGYEGEIELEPAFYGASPDTYLAALGQVSDALERVMIVGHNPGMEMLVQELAGRYERFPTAALAHLELETETWHDVTRARSRLLNLWLPRELE